MVPALHMEEVNTVATDQNSTTRQFTRNILLMVAVNVLIKPLYLFFIDIPIQEALGFQQYGQYFTLIDLGLLLFVILDPGLQNYSSTQIAQTNSLEEVTAPLLGTKLVVSMGYLGASLAVFFLLGFPLPWLSSFLPIVLYLIILSGFTFFRAYIAAAGLYQQDAWLSGLDKVALAITLGIPLYLLATEFSLASFLWGQVIGITLACLVAWLIIRRAALPLRVSFDPSRIKAVLRSCIPYALILFLMAAVTKLDGVMLERLLRDEGRAAGAYASAFRFFDLTNVFGALFGGLLLPMYARHIHQEQERQSLFEMAFRMLLLIGTGIGTVGFLCSDVIYSWIYSEAYQEYAPVFAYLMLGAAAVFLSHAFGGLFLASGRMTQINTIFAGGLLMNFVMNWFLIPNFEALGAAQASLVSQLFMLGGMAFVATKSGFVRWPEGLVRSSIFFLIIALSGGVGLKSLEMDPFWSVLLISGWIIMISFAVGLLRVKDFSFLINRRI